MGDSSNDLKEELLSARRAEEVVKSELAGVCAAKDALARQLDEVRTNLTWETSKASELEEQLSALKSELASARDARVELERELEAMRDGFEAQLEAQKGAGADMKLETERLEELVAILKNEIEANSVLRERMQTEKQAEDSYVTALNEEIEALRLELP